MKTKLPLILLSLSIISCSTTKESNLDELRVGKFQENELNNDRPIYDMQINEIYQEISATKYRAFIRCLSIGHNKSELSNEFVSQDFNTFEFPGYEILNRIDTIVVATHKEILLDSIFLSETWMRDPNWMNDRGKKRVIAHCLDMFVSEELDRLLKSK